MDDPSAAASQPEAKPSTDPGEETPTADGSGDRRPFETPQRMLADALVVGLDPGGLPRRFASLVAAATGAAQVLLWLGEQPEAAQSGANEVLSQSDLDAARARA